MEANPDRFMREILPGALRHSAGRLARFLGAEADDLVFIENATSGINAVLRSLSFKPGDEILIATHTYEAVRQAVRYTAEQTGAVMVEAEIVLPVADEAALISPFAAKLTNRTRLLIVDHIASPTGLVFPVAKIAALARSHGARVLIDGAHAPGQLALDVTALGCDWYVGNCHKWLFAPKGTGFLWARRDTHAGLHPLAISHGYRQGLAMEFDWTGTRDFPSWLAMDAALDFFTALDADLVRRHNHDLVTQSAERIAAAWGTSVDAPAALHGSMMAIRLPQAVQTAHTATLPVARSLMSLLLMEHRIVAPIVPIQESLWVRISAQVYNTPDDYEQLLAAGLRIH